MMDGGDRWVFHVDVSSEPMGVVTDDEKKACLKAMKLAQDAGMLLMKDWRSHLPRDALLSEKPSTALLQDTFDAVIEDGWPFEDHWHDAMSRFQDD